MKDNHTIEKIALSYGSCFFLKKGPVNTICLFVELNNISYLLDCLKRKHVNVLKSYTLHYVLDVETRNLSGILRLKRRLYNLSRI